GDDADRRFVRVLAAVLDDGLEAVEVAVREALLAGVASDDGTVRNFVREAIGWNGRDHRYGNRQGRFGPASGWS
ncbi:hypothetical protein, partial [Sphingomonas sp. DC1100-1]|uniref:hypothetical protein n=1 Tax=unclassified Sphingomonas TaxID=196159 RepID=UPI003CEEE0CE